jgi:hypothetical protein
MKTAAVVLGLAAFGGLIVLAVAGVSGATAVLVTGGAVVAMIGLGNLVGGRRTPDRAPYDADAADRAPYAAGAEHVEDVEPGEQAAEGRQATPE